MERQTYKNHIRYYTPHHFVYYPILLVLLCLSIYFSFTSPEHILWVFISIIFVFLFCLAFMLRQHYALILQDRIVRLELRYRYFSLTGKRLEEFESKLRDSQIFALRFASDSELPAMVEKVLKDNLSARGIKKSIVNWKGDYHRV